MQIEFSDTYCRWHVPEYRSGENDELHVQPKTKAARIGLTTALETGENVIRTGGSTKYKVIRRAAGTFVLVNARGLR